MKVQSGRLGVVSMTCFLSVDDDNDLANLVLKAEQELRSFVFDNMKADFPRLLRQFVQPNNSLVLLRLANTLNVSQALHVDALHGFPHSQYGCFIALNCNQRCHAVLDTSKSDFEILCPEMKKGVMKIFKSASHAHSGVSCYCDIDCQVAVTWYQDCVVEHSTGSVAKYSVNANLFSQAFDALCQSKIPCVVNCGVCRLEILVSTFMLTNG